MTKDEIVALIEEIESITVAKSKELVKVQLKHDKILRPLQVKFNNLNDYREAAEHVATKKYYSVRGGRLQSSYWFIQKEGIELQWDDNDGNYLDSEVIPWEKILEYSNS